MYLVTCEDHHLDDEHHLHATIGGAMLRVAELEQRYGTQYGEWVDDDEPGEPLVYLATTESDDGPTISVAAIEVSP